MLYTGGNLKIKVDYMIKDNQTRLNRLHVLLDALVIAAAYVFSWFITLKSGLFGADLEAGILPTWFYMRVLVVIIPVYLLLYTIFHLFTPKRVQGRRQEFANVCKANIIGLFLFGTILYVGRKNPYLREFSARLVAGFFHYRRNAGTEPDPYRAALHACKGLQSEAYHSGGLQPCS